MGLWSNNTRFPARVLYIWDSLFGDSFFLRSIRIKYGRVKKTKNNTKTEHRKHDIIILLIIITIVSFKNRRTCCSRHHYYDGLVCGLHRVPIFSALRRRIGGRRTRQEILRGNKHFITSYARWCASWPSRPATGESTSGFPHKGGGEGKAVPVVDPHPAKGIITRSDSTGK